MPLTTSSSSSLTEVDDSRSETKPNTCAGETQQKWVSLVSSLNTANMPNKRAYGNTQCTKDFANSSPKDHDIVEGVVEEKIKGRNCRHSGQQDDLHCLDDQKKETANSATNANTSNNSSMTISEQSSSSSAHVLETTSDSVKELGRIISSEEIEMMGNCDRSHPADKMTLDTPITAASSAPDASKTTNNNHMCFSTSASGSTEVVDANYSEELSFLNVSADSEQSRSHHFDEFEFSVSSDEDSDDNDSSSVCDDDDHDHGKPQRSPCKGHFLEGTSDEWHLFPCLSLKKSITLPFYPEPKPNCKGADNTIEPTKSMTTVSSNGDSVSTESTTSLSSQESARTAEMRNKASSAPAVAAAAATTTDNASSTTTAFDKNSNKSICSSRQELLLSKRSQPPSASRNPRLSDTPTSFRSKEFQQYLSSFHCSKKYHVKSGPVSSACKPDGIPEDEFLFEHPPIGNVDNRFESVLDRPFRYWKALDQILEYEYPEWLTYQRGRMIHHLVHFLELKVGFQDYSIEPPTRSSFVFTDEDDSCHETASLLPIVPPGGGQLMPSPVVDEAWRALVLESQLYETITRYLQEFHGQPCYQYIHYSRVKKTMRMHSQSSGGMSQQGITIPEQLTTTQNLFQDYFRELMPASIRQVRTTKPIRSTVPASRFSRALTIKTNLARPTTTSSKKSATHHPKPAAAHQRLQPVVHISRAKQYLLDARAKVENDMMSPSSGVSLRGLHVLNGIDSPHNHNNNKNVLWC
ncbi:MAG: hypothetical protein SGBAC_011067 [Bacillariaceae sp.]